MMKTWDNIVPDQFGRSCTPVEEQPIPGWAAQDRLRPTPDYGTLGPGSDIASGSVVPPTAKKNSRKLRFALVATGCVLALLLRNATNAKASWEQLGDFLAEAQHSQQSGPVDLISAASFSQLDRLEPQKQAERLLELAISNSKGSNQEIAQRVDSWRGKLSLDSQLGALTTAALNSNDLKVRESGIEVQLAAYGLAKDDSTVDVLIETANSSDHAQKIWALWALGALANRGVQAARIEQILARQLKNKDADEDSRRWAVEGLSLVGTSTTIALLLEAMHDDPSPTVRERAACSLAESGMLNHDQRLAAVPQLVNYAADSSLDSQTHAWAFQALADITKEHLPNDADAWRNWYASTRNE